MFKVRNMCGSIKIIGPGGSENSPVPVLIIVNFHPLVKSVFGKDHLQREGSLLVEQHVQNVIKCHYSSKLHSSKLDSRHHPCKLESKQQPSICNSSKIKNEAVDKIYFGFKLQHNRSHIMTTNHKHKIYNQINKTTS